MRPAGKAASDCLSRELSALSARVRAAAAAVWVATAAAFLEEWEEEATVAPQGPLAAVVGEDSARSKIQNLAPTEALAEEEVVVALRMMVIATLAALAALAEAMAAMPK